MSTVTFGTANDPSAQAHEFEAHGVRAKKHPIEYRVIWTLVFGSSLLGGLVVRLVIRPVVALLRAGTGGAAPATPVRARRATLLGEARAAADAAAPFVFQVS